jgi:ParB/RepB/Spo0J family partition protein
MSVEKTAELVLNKTKANDFFNVDPRNIEVDESENVREDYGDIEGLAMSIANNGLIEPIQGYRVRGTDKFKLVDGFRRMRAINLAIEKGYVIPYVKLMLITGNNEDRLFAMVITGTDKKPLTALEEGDTYKRLVLLSYNAKEIAHRVGKSVAHIYERLKLADLPKVVKDSITNDEITATTVSHIIREVKDTDKVIEVVAKAVAERKPKADGSKGKAKVKDLKITKLKTSIEKLIEAHDLLTVEAENEMTDKLYDLIILLQNKKSTAEEIAKLFS